MDLYSAIESRRSIRGYTDRPVPDAALDRILEAARLAPSACNNQPWRFYVVKCPTMRQRLGGAYKAPWFSAAPVIVVACAVPAEAWSRGDGKNYADVDVTIAMEHLILAATAEGLGTCWIGAFDVQAVKQALALPEGVEPLAMTPLGYSDLQPAARGRKALAEIVTVVE
jgi:nitroreductase